MIAHLRGELVVADAESVIIDVGGVGYRCLVPTSTRALLPPAGKEVLLHTSLQVREDSMTLYGFLTREEFGLFELLLRVDGIGPKAALGLLSAMAPEALRRAIAFEDVPALTRAPGIGKKTAQRIVLELKDKVGAAGGGEVADVVRGSGTAAAPAAGGEDPYREALEALVVLGYSRSEAGQALEKAREEAGEAPRTEDLVRLSLKLLFRG